VHRFHLCVRGRTHSGILAALGEVARGEFFAAALFNERFELSWNGESVPNDIPALFGEFAKSLFPRGAIHAGWRLDGSLDEEAVAVATLGGASDLTVLAEDVELFRAHEALALSMKGGYRAREKRPPLLQRRRGRILGRSRIERWGGGGGSGVFAARWAQFSCNAEMIEAGLNPGMNALVALGGLE